jgi:hypothetical protein
MLRCSTGLAAPYWSENKAPAAQLSCAGAVQLSPPLTEEKSPLAVFPRPPLTEDNEPLAVFSTPPLIEEENPMAVLRSPLLTEEWVP